MYFAEHFQCQSIRWLLQLQPWYKCATNLPPIWNFYENLGTRKVIFVANHRSNLDTFILISHIPGLRGLAKKSIYYNIFFAPFMMVNGFIPVAKGNVSSFVQGLHQLKIKILDLDRPVLVFPETTRCLKNFSGVQKFSPSVFQIAMDSQATVVPIVIKDSDQTMGRGDFLLKPFQKMEVIMLQQISTAHFSDSKLLSDHVSELIMKELS